MVSSKVVGGGGSGRGHVEPHEAATMEDVGFEEGEEGVGARGPRETNLREKARLRCGASFYRRRKF